MIDLKARREELLKELQEFTNKVLQYQGAIAMLDELLKESESATVTSESSRDDTSSRP